MYFFGSGFIFWRVCLHIFSAKLYLGSVWQAAHAPQDVDIDPVPVIVFVQQITYTKPSDF